MSGHCAVTSRHRGRAAAVAFLMISSCEESLPPYEDPHNILTGSVSADYIFGMDQNFIRVLLTYRNGYDETLSGKAVIQGSGEIVLVGDTSLHKSFVWNTSHMVGAPEFDPVTRVLTLDPGDSIQFVYNWDFRDDQGRDLRETEFVYYPDQACEAFGRRIGYPEKFHFASRMKLFEKTAVVEADSGNLEVCYIDRWVDPRVCTPLFPSTSCLQIR